MNKVEGGCLIFCMALSVVICIYFGLVGIATWLWGLIVVPVFSLPALGYWQMFGLSWLINFLFKGTSLISTSVAKAVKDI